jgi:hypothetical protein
MHVCAVTDGSRVHDTDPGARAAGVGGVDDVRGFWMKSPLRARFKASRKSFGHMNGFNSSRQA